MKIPNPAGLIGIGKTFIMANRPELLFGTSVVTTVAAVVSAARGGYKSGYTVAEEDIKRKVVGAEVMDRKEIAQLTWLNYLPAAGITAGALGATTGLHLVHVKEKKQLAAAALIAIEQVQKEAKDYKAEILESVGVSDSEDPKAMEKASKQTRLARLDESLGGLEDVRYPVRDVKTGRDEWLNKRIIEETVLSINQRLANEDVELNQFYVEAGFETIPEGEEIGWNAGTYIGLEWDTTVNDKGVPVRTFLVTPSPTASMWEKD